MYMLIDNTTVEETRIICRADIHAVQLLGRYYKLKGRKVIAPPIGGKGFAKLDLESLKYLFWNTFNQTPVDEYKELLQNCKKMVNDVPENEVALKELTRMVEGLTPEDSQPEGSNKQVPVKNKKSVNSNARPKKGTVTGDVWDMCDELLTSLGHVPERKEVIAYCMEEGGINKATASTQYAKWKKASKNLEEKG